MYVGMRPRAAQGGLWLLWAVRSHVVTDCRASVDHIIHEHIAYGATASVRTCKAEVTQPG